MIIRLEALRLAANAGSAGEDNRFNLHAIQVRKDGVVAATNGHYAIRMRSNTQQPSLFDELQDKTEADQARDLIVDASEAKAFFDASKKLIKKGKEEHPVHVTVALRGGEVKLNTADGLVARRFDIKFNEEQIFPNMDRVIPAANPEIAVAFDINYLAAIVRTCKQVGAKFLILEPGKDQEAQWRFCANSVAGYIDGAIMPCRGVDSSDIAADKAAVGASGVGE